MNGRLDTAPAPMPWSARAAMNTGIVGDIAHARLPTTKTATPARNVRLRPQRSDPGPQMGMLTAVASMYAANVHA